MHSSGGGYCDCGDEEAWTRGAWCRIHGGEEEDDDKSASSALRSVEEGITSDAEQLKTLLSKLPEDLVRRCAFLLEPLINSTSVVLFQILQACSKILLNNEPNYSNFSLTLSFSALLSKNKYMFILAICDSQGGVAFLF